MEALGDLPETLFDTYERILGTTQERAFARTALTLICSNTTNIKSADVLVQASLHNVQHGIIHKYTTETLKDILGCLIKTTDIKKRPTSLFRRDEEVMPLQKVSFAHYTVREFLFAPPRLNGTRPAGEFAVSETDVRKLEIQVVFNGLRQWGRNRPQGQKYPTRYEEHCLVMADQALRGSRRGIIVNDQDLFDSVVACLIPGSPHIKALTNTNIRQKLKGWRKLFMIDTISQQAPPNNKTRDTSRPTGTLASLMLLEWPEFAQKYLQSSYYEKLPPREKRAVWTDEFTIDPPNDDSLPNVFHKGERITLLYMCVVWKRLDFLELFINAGANFENEPDIVYIALQDPYRNKQGFGGDDMVTGQLLKMLLERGADPHPKGYRFTPLQKAVSYLEDSWVQSLLIEGRDANMIGEPNGDLPHGEEKEYPWCDWHPLDICRKTKPLWHESEGMEDQVEKARKQVEMLLYQYGARKPQPPPPQVIDLES